MKSFLIYIGVSLGVALVALYLESNLLLGIVLGLLAFGVVIRFFVVMFSGLEHHDAAMGAVGIGCLAIVVPVIAIVVVAIVLAVISNSDDFWADVTIVSVCILIAGYFMAEFFRNEDGDDSDDDESPWARRKRLSEIEDQAIAEIQTLSSQDRLNESNAIALIKASEEGGGLVQHLPPPLRAVRELMIEAVSRPKVEPDEGPTGSPLEFASAELRNDREVVRAAIMHSPYAFDFASEELRSDEDIILRAAGHAVAFAGPEILDGAGGALAGVLDAIPSQFFHDSPRFYRFLVMLNDHEVMSLLTEPTYGEDWFDEGWKQAIVDRLSIQIKRLFQDESYFIKALTSPDIGNLNIREIREYDEWILEYAPEHIFDSENRFADRDFVLALIDHGQYEIRELAGELSDDLQKDEAIIGVLQDKLAREFIGQLQHLVHKRKLAKQHRQGTDIWPDGSKYVGEWKAGLRNGHGTRTHPDGSKYVGEWKDDEEWQGTKYDTDGNVTGIFIAGEMFAVSHSGE